jgi:PKD repeat protein
MITYEQPGNYNVSLTISNANGQASKTFENYIVVTSSIISQTLYIPAGWSGISSNLIPQNTIVGNILQPILNDLIVLQNMNGVFYPEMGINTIGLWDYKQGYKIKTNAETQLNITGWQNEQQTLDLIAGWNLIPIMSNLNQNIELLFSGLPQNGLLVKEVAGTSLYWPEMNINTLLELEPGKAYFVKIVNPATIYFMNDPLK